MNTTRDHNTMSASDHAWIMALMRRRNTRPRASQSSAREGRVMRPTASIKEEGYHPRASCHHQQQQQHSRNKSISNHGMAERHSMATKKTPAQIIHRPSLHRRVTDSTADPPVSAEDIDIPFVVTVSRVGDTTSDRDDTDSLSEISYEEEEYHLFGRSAFETGMEDEGGLGFSWEAPVMLESSTTTTSLGVANRWGMTTLCLEEGSIGRGLLERHGGVEQLSDSVVQELLVSQLQQRVIIGE